AKRAFSMARRSSGTAGRSSDGSRTAPDGRMTGPRATPGTTGVPVSTAGPTGGTSESVPGAVVDMVAPRARGRGREADCVVLERAGMLRRVHGGAVPAGALALVETGLGERHGTRTEQKRKIAAAALDLLPGLDGSLVLDGGSTTAALAEVLPTDRRLYVATNS